VAQEWIVRLRQAVGRNRVIRDDAVGVSITLWRRRDRTGWYTIGDETTRIRFGLSAHESPTSILRVLLDELRRIDSDEEEIPSKRGPLGFSLPSDEETLTG
jgi:hypothetical protein